MMIRKSRIYNDPSYIIRYRVMWYINDIVVAHLSVYRDKRYTVNETPYGFLEYCTMTADEVEEYIDNLVKLECL